MTDIETPRMGRFWAVGLVIGSVAALVVLLILGKGWLATGAIPTWAGLWWLLLPLAVLATWLFLIDGRMTAPRRARA